MTNIANDLTRRKFIRKVGAGVVSITVVDLLFGKSRLVFACGEGASDSTCGGSSMNADENCGVSSDSDNNCGTGVHNSNDTTCGDSNDSDDNCGTGSQNTSDQNCGQSTTGGMTDGPNGTDVDESCQTSMADSDNNCGISYNPNPAVDVDNSCNTDGSDADQSCGDCNDNHQPDDHCGEELTGGATDSDELCGHEHLYGYGSTDSVCSDTEPDVGCGVHSNDYSWTADFKDDDEYCSATHADRNCSEASSDATCNASHSPSSTSPDENCSADDADAACSLYDRDESCGDGSKDEACGITTVEGYRDITDPDANCSPPGDPDSSGGFPCPLGGG